MASNEKLYDNRTIKRSLKQGKLSKQDLEKHNQALDDCQGMFEELKVFEEESEEEVTESSVDLKQI